MSALEQTGVHLEGPFRAGEKREVDQFVSNFIYQGDLDLPIDGRQLSFHLEQIASVPCPLYVLRSGSEYVWRRTSSHIRLDASDFCALRLLRSGRASITQSGRTVDMLPGDLVVNRSTMPIRVSINPAPAEQGVEMIIALVPSAVLQQKFNVNEVVNQTLPRESSHYRVLIDMIRLFEIRATDIDPDTAEYMSSAFYGEVAKLGQIIAAPAPVTKGVNAERTAHIRSMIRMHFANPNLSLAMIASKCGISPRYVTYVMKKSGSSFYDELRNERLGAAKRMLQKGKLPVKQVAYFTGFKSAAHFSAAYKRKYGHPPREEEALMPPPMKLEVECDNKNPAET